MQKFERNIISLQYDLTLCTSSLIRITFSLPSWIYQSISLALKISQILEFLTAPVWIFEFQNINSTNRLTLLDFQNLQQTFRSWSSSNPFRNTRLSHCQGNRQFGLGWVSHENWLQWRWVLWNTIQFGWNHSLKEESTVNKNAFYNAYLIQGIYDWF